MLDNRIASLNKNFQLFIIIKGPPILPINQIMCQHFAHSILLHMLDILLIGHIILLNNEATICCGDFIKTLLGGTDAFLLLN
jgi:hypothetical protein